MTNAGRALPAPTEGFQDSVSCKAKLSWKKVAFISRPYYLLSFLLHCFYNTMCRPWYVITSPIIQRQHMALRLKVQALLRQQEVKHVWQIYHGQRQPQKKKQVKSIDIKSYLISSCPSHFFSLCTRICCKWNCLPGKLYKEITVTYFLCKSISHFYQLLSILIFFSPLPLSIDLTLPTQKQIKALLIAFSGP